MGRNLPGESCAGGYRFGFQGQEQDDEVKRAGNSVNYKYRVHDVRLGRFLSVDPLVAEYPWNSPYAFSENRVIDGVELEGAEYVHYYVFLESNWTTVIKKVAVEYFRNMPENSLKGEWDGFFKSEFYEKYFQSFGPEGRGVKYTYFARGRDGRFVKGGSLFESSEGPFSHGFYYGAGGPTEQGDRSAVPPGSGQNRFIYDGLDPIDEVDALAREHDQAYERAGVEDWHSDPKGIEADKVFVQGLKEYQKRASQDGYVDKNTGRPPSKEAFIAAEKGILAFTYFFS